MAFITTSRTSGPVRRGRVSLLGLLSLARQRYALSQLDDRALDDIGVTRAQADKEAKSSFWDVPEHWRR